MERGCKIKRGSGGRQQGEKRGVAIGSGLD